MTDRDEFSGRSALITGGTRGIGKGIADRLRAGGARVLVAARSIAEALTPTTSCSPTSAPPTALPHWPPRRFDGSGTSISRCTTWAAPVSTTAGLPRSLTRTGSSRWTRICWRRCGLDRAIIPGMVDRGSGAIVHITSIQRRAPLPTSIPYAAAKAALTNYSKALSNELGPKGIRVNAVCPGYIETESAYRMAVEIGEMNGITIDEARGQIMESIGGIPLGAPGAPPMSANSSRSWSPTAPPTSTAPST